MGTSTEVEENWQSFETKRLFLQIQVTSAALFLRELRYMDAEDYDNDEHAGIPTSSQRALHILKVVN